MNKTRTTRVAPQAKSKPGGAQRLAAADGRLQALSSLAKSAPTTRRLASLQAMADQSQTVQRMSETDEEEPAQLKARTSETHDGGMPTQLRAGVEALSGVSMDGVRVHRNSSAPAQVNAHAFAQGRDIHLGPDQEQHLPHEAWHVVQQAQGRVSVTADVNGVGINDDRALEQEAGIMGQKAMSAPLADAVPTVSVSTSETFPTQPVMQRKISLQFNTEPPGGRHENKIGLGEDATVLSDKKTDHPVFTKESGPGTLAGQYFSANDQSGVVKFSVKNAAEDDMFKEHGTFYVVAPQEATMNKLRSGNDEFGDDVAGAAFHAGITLHPGNVSFSGLEFSEGNGALVATGAYADENGRNHDFGPAIPLNSKNAIRGSDHVSTAAIPEADVEESKADWPISWRYRVPGGAWVEFTTGHHKERMDANGYTKVTKNGEQETRKAPWNT